jgi:hypothetical protein
MAIPDPIPNFTRYPTRQGVDVYVGDALVQRQLISDDGDRVFGSNLGSDVFRDNAPNVADPYGADIGSVFLKNDVPSCRGIAIKMASGGDANVVFIINGARPLGDSVAVPGDGEFHEFLFDSEETIPQNSNVQFSSDTLASVEAKFLV